MIYNYASDGVLIAASCVYAAWLAEHKNLEPDMTWLEVGVGVSYCLAHALARSARHGGDWKAAHVEVWRSVTIGAVPIVIGEAVQWLKRRKARREFQKRWDG